MTTILGLIDEDELTDRHRELAGEAADLIEKHGHCKGQGIDGAGRMCLFGALGHAESIKDRRVDGSQAWILTDYLREQVHGTFVNLFKLKHELIAWNDSEIRTAAEVIALLRKVASNA